MNEKSTLTNPAVKFVHINLDFFVHKSRASYSPPCGGFPFKGSDCLSTIQPGLSITLPQQRAPRSG